MADIQLPELYPDSVIERRILHNEVYQGREIEVIWVHETREAYQRPPYTSHYGSLITPSPEAAIDRTWIEGRLDGRTYQGLRGNADTGVLALVKKIRKLVDADLFDDSIRADVLKAINAFSGTLREEDGWRLVIGRSIPDGSLVWVHGTGRWRQGIVVGKGRKNTKVAYTTPSSGGRIFYQSVEKVWVRGER